MRRRETAHVGLVARAVEEAGGVAVVLLVLRAREHLAQRVVGERRRRGAVLERHGVEHVGGGGGGGLARRPRFVDGAAVREGRDVHVLRALEPPLDLEGADARLEQPWHVVDATEVLRRQQVGTSVGEFFELAVDHQAVRHPALLRALAAVGRAPAARLRREALPIVRDAHVAVDENFDVRIRDCRRHRRDVVD